MGPLYGAQHTPFTKALRPASWLLPPWQAWPEPKARRHPPCPFISAAPGGVHAPGSISGHRAAWPHCPSQPGVLGWQKSHPLQGGATQASCAPFLLLPPPPCSLGEDTVPSDPPLHPSQPCLHSGVGPPRRSGPSSLHHVSVWLCPQEGPGGTLPAYYCAGNVPDCCLGAPAGCPMQAGTLHCRPPGSTGTGSQSQESDPRPGRMGLNSTLGTASPEEVIKTLLQRPVRPPRLTSGPVTQELGGEWLARTQSCCHTVTPSHLERESDRLFTQGLCLSFKIYLT